MRKIIRKIISLNKKKWRHQYDEMLKKSTVGEKFKLIYEKNLWRNAESLSGSGSTLKFTRKIRESLPELVSKLKISSIFDAPCGDFNWMKHAIQTIDVNYIGADIVEELIQENIKRYSARKIQFRQLNLIEDYFPEADMMICRDCLFHMSFKDTLKILTNFLESEISYIYTTTYNKPESFNNMDINTGDFRAIDLRKFPYSFPEGDIFSVLDGKEGNTERHMTVWSKNQIFAAVHRMNANLGNL